MSSSPPDRTARSLGWASLALGVPQVLAPERFARAVGLPAHDRATVVGVGVRELLAGAGLLTGKATGAFLWSRVVGDLMDLSVLRTAWGRRDRRTRVAACAVAGIGVLDLAAALGHGRGGSPVELTAVTTVLRAPDDVYDVWRGLERLPTFMHHLESVEWTGEGRTHWRAAAPLAGKVAWDAELVEDVRGRRVAWRSLPGSQVRTEGQVEFSPAPGDRGTEVRVQMSYTVPGGRAGRAFARLFGEEPHQQVEDDLRRFKQLVETGQVVRSDGSPEGHSASRQLVQRPAQPVG
jgi:uncharacterized membrane protein